MAAGGGAIAVGARGDLVEPRRIGRDEVKVVARVARQPSLLFVFVRWERLSRSASETGGVLGVDDAAHNVMVHDGHSRG